jgi:SynChlorMet cassette protein ScmA
MDYEPPKLVHLNDQDNEAKGATCLSGSGATPECNIGTAAGGASGCTNGASANMCSPTGNGV